MPYPPESPASGVGERGYHRVVWYRRTFAERGQRGRKVGIVALARKLAIALWRFVENGVVPEGAVLSSR